MTRFLNVPSLTALFLCSSLSTISTQALAATVNVSDNLVISAVNDKRIENSFLHKKSSFELNQGEHALILRYKDVFEDLEFNEERRVESQDFVVKFTITDQEQLELSTVEIKDLAAAENFKKSPELQLKDDNNNQLSLSLEEVSDYKLAKQVDIAVSALATNKVIQTQGSGLPAATVLTDKQTGTPIRVNSLDMLKYWWQNASTDEKKRFKEFTKAN